MVMTTLIINDDHGNSRKVEVEISVINNSCYFKDLLCFMQVPQDGVLFPPQYSKAVNMYLDYAKDHSHQQMGIKIRTKVNNYKLEQLKLGFELCHYLDDDKFLAWLVEYVCIVWSHIIGSKNNIIDKLHPNIQRDIYLHVPLCLVPISFQSSNTSNSYQQGEAFIHEWIAINKGKIYTTNGYKYKADIEYYDNLNTDIKGITYSRESFISPYHKHGITKLWYPLTTEGKKILYEEMYYNNGQKHGIRTAWFPTGHLKQVCNYYNDKMHGKTTVWWPPMGDTINDSSNSCQNGNQCDNQLKSVIDFVNGVRTGCTTEYHPNGQKDNQGCYTNNGRCGKWSAWYPSGNILCTTTFKNDIRYGVYKEYYDTQQHDLMREYHFDDKGQECNTLKMWWPPRSQPCDVDYSNSNSKDINPLPESVETHNLKYCYKCKTNASDSMCTYTEWDEQGNCTYDISDNHDLIANSPKIATLKTQLGYGLFIEYRFGHE